MTAKRQSDRETAGFEAEWRQLSKLIETDRRQQAGASDLAAVPGFWIELLFAASLHLSWYKNLSGASCFGTSTAASR